MSQSQQSRPAFSSGVRDLAGGQHRLNGCWGAPWMVPPGPGAALAQCPTEVTASPKTPAVAVTCAFSDAVVELDGSAGAEWDDIFSRLAVRSYVSQPTDSRSWCETTSNTRYVTVSLTETSSTIVRGKERRDCPPCSVRSASVSRRFAIASTLLALTALDLQTSHLRWLHYTLH